MAKENDIHLETSNLPVDGDPLIEKDLENGSDLGNDDDIVVEVGTVPLDQKYTEEAIKKTLETGAPFFEAVIFQDLAKIKSLNKEFADSDIVNAEDPAEESSGWTSLHLAAYLKNSELVGELCNHPLIDIITQDPNLDTPLHVASYWDHTGTIDILLKKAHQKGTLASLINAQNDKKETPFSYAASRYHKDTCKMMIDYIPPLDFETGKVEEKDQYFCTLQKEKVSLFLDDNRPIILFHQKTKTGSSPINLLIAKLPELVKEILDKAIVEKKIEDINKSKYKETYRIVVDFGALQDYKDTKNSDMEDTYEQAGAVYEPGSYKDGNNPLQIMVQKQRIGLLKHPVVDALITQKWESFARAYFYAVTFLFYMLFFAMLLIYETTQIQPYVNIGDGETKRAWIENATHKCGNGTDGCFTAKSTVTVISGYIVFVMAVLRLLLEGLDFGNETFVKTDTAKQSGRQIWIGLKTYFLSAQNILEITLYGTAIVFSANVFCPGLVMTSLQWQCGTLCVFAAFINLLMLLRVVPFIGLYIIMFIRIFQTFMTKIFLLFGFFIIAFVVIFHMLLCQTNIFRNFMGGNAIYKTLSQGVSGVAYEDYEMDDITLDYPYATLVGLIIFAIFVQVLFLNLATGLAIEDVKEIREDAEGEMSAIQITHIFHAEKILCSVQSTIKLELMSYQKRFQNFPSKNFSLDKIQEVREEREALKVPSFENARQETLKEVLELLQSMQSAK